jgi:uncharacterized membrane protein
MTTQAIILVLLSTFAHAFWNLHSKRQNPTAAYFVVALMGASVCLLPVVALYGDVLPQIPAAVWLWLVATGICQAAYYIGLAGAYRHGDMSVAYPLARALPALMVAGVSVVLGLGEPLGAWGLIGVAVVGAGCLILPLPAFRAIRPSSYWNVCCALALLAACGTAGYTLIDNQALGLLRGLPTLGLGNLQLALLYMSLETLIGAVALGVFVALNPVERRACRSVLRTGKRQAVYTGLMISGTYGLVLAAMAYVTNISYLAAFRELSIPLGATLGMIFQGEAAHAPKIVGIGMVLAGLLLIGLA